jgi:hypothetical protein
MQALLHPKLQEQIHLVGAQIRGDYFVQFQVVQVFLLFGFKDFKGQLFLCNLRDLLVLVV